MKRGKYKLTRVACLRCGHSWVPRVADTRVCPGCKSPYWDRPLQRKKAEERKEE